MKSFFVSVLLLCIVPFIAIAQGGGSSRGPSKFEAAYEKASWAVQSIENEIKDIEDRISENRNTARTAQREMKLVSREIKIMSKNSAKDKEIYTRTLKYLDKEEKAEAKAEFKATSLEQKAELKGLTTKLKDNSKLRTKAQSEALKGKANVKKLKAKRKAAKRKQKDAYKIMKEAEKYRRP